MTILEQLRLAFRQFCKREKIGLSETINIEPLTPADLYENENHSELPLLQGKEHLIQASYGRFQGQVFTPEPCAWEGSIQEVLDSDMSDMKNRSLLFAIVNAVVRSKLDMQCTEDCQGRGPVYCAPEIASRMEVWFGLKKYALIGFQPLVIQNLIESFGAKNIKVLEIAGFTSEDTYNGVEILHGLENLETIVEWCDVGISSGITLVDDTIDTIWNAYNDTRKPIIFFGTTVSGTAALTGLQWICPGGY